MPLKSFVHPGRRGTSVKEWNHRTGSCQDDSRRGHVGGGEHQRSPHGKKPNGANILPIHQAVGLTVQSFHRLQMISTRESLLSILNRFRLLSLCLFMSLPPSSWCCYYFLSVCRFSKALKWNPGCTFAFWTWTHQQYVVGNRAHEMFMLLPFLSKKNPPKSLKGCLRYALIYF